jgi:hypothetical protein
MSDDEKILTPERIDCHRRIGRNQEPAQVAWVEYDAVLDSHELLRGRAQRMRDIDKAFYDFTVQQRDNAWRECADKQARIELLEELVAHMAGFIDIAGDDSIEAEEIRTCIRSCVSRNNNV